MTVTVDAVIDEARTWHGTRWRHQGRRKGIAVDCVGLIIGVARNLKLEPRHAPGTTFDTTDYDMLPDGGRLMALCQKTMIQYHGKPAPGIVGVFRFDAAPQHLGLLTDRGMIHSHSKAHLTGKRGAGWCVEHPFADVWRNRMVAMFKLPGVAY